MSAVALLVPAILLVIAVWLLLKDRVLRSPIDQVPGPSSPSLLSGKYRYWLLPILCLSRGRQVIWGDSSTDTKAGNFMMSWRLSMPPSRGFEECLGYVLTLLCARDIQLITLSKERILYVFDPTALHSIIIKDQQYYEEASFSISLVSSNYY